MQTDIHATGARHSIRTLLATTRWRMVLLLFVLYTVNCIDRMSL